MSQRIDDPREASGVHKLAALLRGDATCALDQDHDEAGWRTLLRAAHEDDEGRLRRRGGRGWWLLAPVAACVLLAAGWWFYRGTAAPAPLRWYVDGREAGSGAVAAAGDLARRMAFSDGSTVVLRSPGRVQVSATHAHGATLSLERGRLDLSIRHHPGSRWKLEVGPYVVEVTGTRFNVDWDPQAGDFAVDLIEGAVRISGPGIATAIPLQVGQQFHANQAGSYGVEPQPQVGPVPASPPTGMRAPDTAAPSAKAGRLASWAGAGQGLGPARDKPACDFVGLVSSGRFDAAVSEAQGQGIESTLAACPVRSLFALADAARYVAQFDLSRNTLLAIRKRHPDERGKAAFFLGRLEEARGNLDLALSWYVQALDARVEPQFAKEASAGKARIAKHLRSVDPPPSHEPR